MTDATAFFDNHGKRKRGRTFAGTVPGGGFFPFAERDAAPRTSCTMQTARASPLTTRDTRTQGFPGIRHIPPSCGA